MIVAGLTFDRHGRSKSFNMLTKLETMYGTINRLGLGTPDHYVTLLTVYIRPDLHKPIAKHQRQSQIDDSKVDPCA